MIEKGRTYVVMGLLNTDSIAYMIGRTIEAFGGTVIYTVQNERIRRIFFDRSDDLSEADRERIPIRYCDVTLEDEVRDLFAAVGPVAGVVHSVAFANPRTCLGAEFHTDALDDILQSYHISCVSLATVAFFGSLSAA